MTRRPTFVERERIGSIEATEDMAATVRACWQRACEHDDIDPDTSFVVFSDNNPFVVFYHRALEQFNEMASSCAAHGYVGLSMSTRDVYRRRRKKVKA